MKVKSIVRNYRKEHTYDIEVPETHAYCVENDKLISHNSSLVSNSTNGIEPVRSLISIKKSKTGLLKQVVPNFEKYGKFYQTAFDNLDNKSYTNVAAVVQKFMDMAISLNHYYDYRKFDGGSIPLSTIAKDVMYAYSVGVKCLYYANTNDGDGEVEMKQENCASGACSI